MRLSIVIPAYDEALRLPPTLVEITRYLSGHPRWLPAEILVVDDGSRDGTAEVIRDLVTPDGISLRVLIHPENQGKGAAVRTGFAAARGEATLLCDADLSTPIEELDNLAGDPAGDIVIASRALDRDRIEERQPWYRDLMGRVFNLMVQLLAVPGIHDTQCGFKLIPGELGRRLAANQKIDGFAFDVELLARARAWGVPIREVAARWRHMDESRVQPVVHSANMFADLLRISWWRLTGQLRSGAPTEP